MKERFIPFELGCHNRTELNLLPPILKQLSKEFPLLRPSIRLVPFPSLLSLVENNQIHAVLGIKRRAEKILPYFKELCQVPMACICSPEHPFAQFQTLTREQLTGNFIACSPRQIPDSVFSVQSGILVDLSPERRFLTESMESALALVKAEIGYTLYPDIPQAREPGLCYLPVTDLPSVSFGIYHRYEHDHPVLKRFLALMRQSSPVPDSPA